MMQFVALVTLFIAAGSTALDRQIGEAMTDEFISKFNDYMREKELQEITIPDFGYEAAPVFIGVTLKNMSTVYSTGPSSMKQNDDGSLTFTMNLSLRDFHLHVQLCPFMHDSFTWTVGDASVEVTFTLHTSAFLNNSKPSCHTTWDSFLIKRLNDIMVHTANLEWDDRPPPQELMPDIISHYNSWNNLPEVHTIANNNVDVCAFFN